VVIKHLVARTLKLNCIFWFQASAALFIKSPLLWDITQRWVVIIRRRFGTTFRPHLQRVKKSKKKLHIAQTLHLYVSCVCQSWQRLFTYTILILFFPYCRQSCVWSIDSVLINYLNDGDRGMFPRGKTGCFPGGVKQPQRTATHTPPTSAEVKNEWSHISNPTCLYGVNRQSFNIPSPVYLYNLAGFNSFTSQRRKASHKLTRRTRGYFLGTASTAHLCISSLIINVASLTTLPHPSLSYLPLLQATKCQLITPLHSNTETQTVTPLPLNYTHAEHKHVRTRRNLLTLRRGDKWPLINYAS
jgi:hypothetical protein